MAVDDINYAILMNNIVINNDLLNRIDTETGKPMNASDSIVCWTPIPKRWNTINLDGDNYTISGLYINESGKAGLYASLQECSFKNLTITDSFVKGGDNVGVLLGDGYAGYYKSSLSSDNVKIENTIVRGENHVGGLFGSYETGSHENNYTITNCTVGSGVTVTGTGDRVGGIASECRGTILYSSSAATVTGKNFVGGVVGYAGGNAEKIWYCHNDGTVKGETSVGGVLGYGNGRNDPICYIYNTGYVSGDMDVAGLVGTAVKTPKYSYNIGKVEYNDNKIAPQLMNYTHDFATKRCLFYLEGTIPFSKSGEKEQTTTFKPNELNQTAFTFIMDQVTSGELAWKLNLKSDKSEENGYANCWVQKLNGIDRDKCPTFGDARYAVYPSETGYHNHDSADQIDCADCRGVAWDPYYPVSQNPIGNPQYEITNYHELLGLAKLVNEKNNTGIRAVLMNDIVFNKNLLGADGKVQGKEDELIKWTPIGAMTNDTGKNYFNGNFNGNGHTISGLYVNGGDYAGLFGKTQGCPEIKGVGIVDSYFNGTYVGGIAGALIDVNDVEYDFIAGCFTYNVKLEGTNSDKFVGSVSGKGNGRLNSNYCLADNEETLPGINCNCSAMTAKGFESGRVAYLMNNYLTKNGNGNVWGQVVTNSEGEPVDLLPTAYREIGNDGSNKVINFAEQYHNHLCSAA